MRLAVFAVVVVVLASGRSAAADDEDLSGLTIEELLAVEVSVATVEPSTVFRSPSTVTVLTRDMIEAFGFRTVIEALDAVAGYATVRTYSTRNVPTVRGLLNFHYANKVVVLIDGVPTWSAVTGHASLERISIEAVERIEVLKGPASVLYGTNAYAGAINIVLRDAGRDGGSAHGSIGTFGAFAGGGEIEVRRRGLTVFGAIEAFDGGDSAPFEFVDENGVRGLVTDFVRGGAAVATARYRGHQLLLNRFDYEYMRFGTTPTFADGAGHDQVHRGTLVDYRYRIDWRERLDVSGAVTWDDNVRNFDRSADGSLRTNEHGWRLVGALISRFDLRDDVHVEAGAAYDRRTSEEYRNYLVADDSTTSHNNMRDRSVSEASLSAQVEYSGRRLGALAGTRLTDNQLFGSNLSSRATVSYAIRDRHAVKLVVGQAFRAPSLFELYFESDTGTVLGNAELDPETSTSVEVVYLGGLGGLLVQATAYYATYDGIIYRTLVGDINTYANAPALDAIGVELEARYRASDRTDAFASASFLDSVGAPAGAGDYDVLRFAPAVIADVGAAHRVGPLSASGIAHYRGATGGPNQRLGYDWTIDAGIAYRFELDGSDAEVRLDGRNLTDQVVEIPEYVRRGPVNSIPLEGFGRQIFLGLSWSI